MDNFLEFLKEDIKAKKTLITSLPTRTKTNKKKLNQTIDVIFGKYEGYKTSLLKYIKVKSKSFNIKEKENNEKINQIKKKIDTYEYVKNLLNPDNTYFEKLGFDTLLYQINNYAIFNFDSLNEIIDSFLDKFKKTGIMLTSDDFNYTCYVHEYMSAFLEVYYSKNKNYDKVSQIFEKIYWVNPELIEHIELNFRKLIRKNEKKFNNYILNLQDVTMKENNINNYSECLKKVKALYTELNSLTAENIVDIIKKSKNKEIDIGQLKEDSKIRMTAFDSLIKDNIDTSNKKEMNKVVIVLERLKKNIEEYNEYLKFLPMFNLIQNEYKKDLNKIDKHSFNNKTKEVLNKINSRERQLDKLNKKIFNKMDKSLKNGINKDLKHLEVESVVKAKELYELYKNLDKEFFRSRLLNDLSNTLSIKDLLNLLYSFDYFKKQVIKEAYDLNDFKEISEYSKQFDKFASDPTNMIVDGILLFQESDIAKVIANKYTLSNLKINEDDLSEENLQSILNKINLILRVNKIENSSSSIDKISFMVEVDKIINKEEE